MAFPDEPRGAESPSGDPVPEGHQQDPSLTSPNAPDPGTHHKIVSYEPTADRQADEVYAHEGGDWSYAAHPGNPVTFTPEPSPTAVAFPAAGGGSRKPPDPPEPPEEDPEDEGMLRMSFLEHLEELRKRLLLAIGGVGVAFFLSLFFSNQLWLMVSEPAVASLKRLHVDPPVLIMISPMDGFQIIWMKLPILSAVFIASPWILYQVWAFIAPGLYPKERRWASPFVISSAGLFIVGGLFAYFIAFRYGLEFLLGMGLDLNVRPMVSITEYYDLFVDVMLGVGLIFEIPVLIFLLTLIRVVSPAFLVNHSRYAILAIVALAAVITPTGDVFNLALFATPMILLFYVGIFAGYILVLKREKRRFPWKVFTRWFLIVLLVVIVLTLIAAKYYGYHFAPTWPFLTK